jgi:TatD DNase family protein
MSSPLSTDYINIHDHGTNPEEGVFTIDNIMVHEGRTPSDCDRVVYSVGAHPWFLTKENRNEMMERVRRFSDYKCVVAIGETGFDRLKGPELDLQRKVFREHVEISEASAKPLFIHCVRSYDEVLSQKKQLKPGMPWIIHGFRGKSELALQLTGKGLYLSAWVEWAIRPESAETIKVIPPELLFLETDGFDIGIEPVYEVVAAHLGIEKETLRKQVLYNFNRVFK